MDPLIGRRLTQLTLAACLVAGTAVLHASSPTIEAIRKSGTLTCGIDQSEAEFSTEDEHGSRFAFDRDLCTAVATAILGRHPHIVVHGYPDDRTALSALSHGEIDLLASVSDDLSHLDRSIALGRTVLYDGYALMVPRSSGMAHASDLAGKKVCFLAETEGEVALRAWFKRRSLNLVPFPFQEEGEMEAAFVTGNCTALAEDLTRLGTTRVAFGATAKDYIILADVLSKDPLASATRRDDPAVGTLVNWTVNILIQAEEDGITAAHAADTATVKEPAAARLLGKTHEMGHPFGLAEDWAANVIQEVGNYGEIFNRDLGAGSPLHLPRGQNALWTQGGLMMATPPK